MIASRTGRAVVGVAVATTLAVPTAAYAHSTIFRVAPEPATGNGFVRVRAPAARPLRS